MTYSLRLVTLSSASSCLRLHIPDITLGIGFLGNPARPLHPVSTDSEFRPPSESNWGVTSFLDSVLVRVLEPLYPPGFLQVPARSISKLPSAGGISLGLIPPYPFPFWASH